MRRNKNGGYVLMLMLLVTVAIIVGLYTLKMPGLPVLPGMSTSTGTIISTQLNAVIDAKAARDAGNKHNQELEAALKED